MADKFIIDPMKTTNMGSPIAKRTISPEEAAELQKLYDDFAAAATKCAFVLKSHGMTSPEFLEADKATSAIWRRIHELLGQNPHWMA